MTEAIVFSAAFWLVGIPAITAIVVLIGEALDKRRWDWERQWR